MSVKRKPIKKRTVLRTKAHNIKNNAKEREEEVNDEPKVEVEAEQKQQPDYFGSYKTYEDMKKYFDEQRKIHHQKQRPLTKEDATTFAEMQRQYEASPLVKEGREQQKRNREIREEKVQNAIKERNCLKGVLTSDDAVGLEGHKNSSNAEITAFANNMFGKITLSGKNNDELSNKFMDFATHEAFKNEIAYMNDYEESNSELKKDDLKFDMEFLRHIENEIGSGLVANRCANKLLKDMKEIQSYDVKMTIGTIKDGYKDISFVGESREEEFDNVVKNNKELSSLRKAVCKGLKDYDKHFDKTNAFKNMLVAKNLSVTAGAMGKLYLGDVNDKIDDDTMEQRADQMLKNIMETKEKSKDNKFHNRDKVRELGELFNAVKMVGNDKLKIEFAQKVLQTIDTIRIHNKAFWIRGLEDDYIKQQNMIDDIRTSVNMEPLGKGVALQNKNKANIEPEIQHPDDAEDEEIDMNQELLQNDPVVDAKKVGEPRKSLIIPPEDIDGKKEEQKSEEIQQKQNVKNPPDIQ